MLVLLERKRRIRKPTDSCPWAWEMSNRFRTALAGADADAVFQRQDENLAVADASFRTGATRFHDGVDGRLDKILIDGNLQLHLVQQIDREFVAAVHLGVPLLPAEAAAVDHRQTEDLDLVESFLDGFHFRRLNDGDDEFHIRDSLGCLSSVLATSFRRSLFAATRLPRRLLVFGLFFGGRRTLPVFANGPHNKWFDFLMARYGTLVLIAPVCHNRMIGTFSKDRTIMTIQVLEQLPAFHARPEI